MQFHKWEKRSHSKSCFPLGKAKSFLPKCKMASVMTPNVYRVFFRHQRLENSAFNMQNSLAKVWYSMNVFYSDVEPLSK